jgi:O-antigen/teichoic acid export membrane protein
MRLGQTSAIFFVSKFLGSLFGFFATVIFARLLGEAVLGQYATVLALVTWVSLFGKVGISESVTKRLSEGEDLGEYAGAALLLIGTISSLMAAGVLIFRGWVEAYVGAPVAVFIAAILLVAILNTFGSSALQGRHMVHVSSVLTTLSQLVRSALQILLLLAGAGLHAMLAVYVFSRLLTGLIALRYVDTGLKTPARRHFKSLFEFAKFSWLGNIQSRVFNTLDILLLKLFVAAGFVGIYSATWSIGIVLDIFGNAIRSTLFPEMSKVSSEDDMGAVAGLTEDALAFAGLLLIPGFIGGLVVGDRLLRIYGDGFARGTEVLGILLFALLIYTYTKQLLNTLNAVDRPDLAFRTNAVFIGANVILNIVLISEYDWQGAAVATLLSTVVGIIISAHYVSQMVDVSPPIREIGRQWIAAGLMGAIVYMVRFLTEPLAITRYNAPYVVFLVVIGASVYFGMLLLISRRFRATVVDNVPFDRFPVFRI